MYEIFVNLSCINRAHVYHENKSCRQVGSVYPEFIVLHWCIVYLMCVRVYLILSKLVHGINIVHISYQDLNYYSYFYYLHIFSFRCLGGFYNILIVLWWSVLFGLCTLLSTIPHFISWWLVLL